MRNDVLRIILAVLVGLAVGSTASAAWAQDEDLDPEEFDGGAAEEDDDFGEATKGDDDDDDDDDAVAADSGPKKPLILPTGKILITGGIPIAVNPDIGRPTSFNPDAWYGAMAKLMVGLVHSPQGITGFFSGKGGGICVTGSDNGCPKVYDSLGLVGRYELKVGSMDLAADGGLILGSLSEATVALKAGVLGRLNKGKLTIWFNPNVFIGFTDRTIVEPVSSNTIQLNSERIHLPVGFTYPVNDKTMAGVQTGLASFIADFGDHWRWPLSFGGFHMLNETTKVGAVFSFDQLLGADGGFDDMTLQLTGAILL